MQLSVYTNFDSSQYLNFYVIVQIRDGGLYRDFKVRVLFEKTSLFNARGLCNPGKVRRRVFELTSQTY